MIQASQTPKATPPSIKQEAIPFLPTFAERGKAIASRVEEIQRNPKYQALSEDKKTAVRADLYKKLVPQSYASFHLPVPDEKTWVAATGRKQGDPLYGGNISTSYGMQGESSELHRRALEQEQDIINGVHLAENNVALFGARVTNKVFMEMQNVAQHFSHYNAEVAEHPALAYTNSETKRAIDNFADASRARIQDVNYYHDIHPRDSMLGQLAQATGEQMALLPLYEAVQAGVVAGGAKAIAGTGAALGEKSLTKVLMNSKIGSWVAKRMADSAVGFLATAGAAGGDKRAAVSGGVIGAVAGPVLEGYGSALVDTARAAGTGIKYASAPLIEKFTANTIAMAGKPFAEELTHSAFAEMQPVDWHMRSDTPNSLTFGKSHDLMMGIRVHPDTEGTGHFSTEDGQIYKYAGKQHQQQVFNTLVKRAEASREISDPVMAKAHEAEKVALDSIAIAKFQKPLAELGKDEKIATSVARMKQITSAAKKAPALLPDLQKLEVESDLAKQAKANPDFAAQVAKYEKLTGGKIADTATENIVKDVKHETGISNADGAVRKVKKAAKETLSASLGMPSDSVAFRQQSRLTLQKDLGEKAKANWSAFYEQLKKAKDSGVRFETPQQRMLYMYGNRKSLPYSLEQKLVGRIRQMKGLGVKDVSMADLQEKADWLHVHLLEMAHAGHFDPNEPGMFASTKSGSPIDGTKYQMQLKMEADAAQIKSVTKALANDPKAIKTFNAAFRGLQKTNEQMYQNPETWLQYRNDLADLADEHLKRHINRVGHTF